MRSALTNQPNPYVFHFGTGEARVRTRRGELLTVFTEDCFTGNLVSVHDKPRELAPFPWINPLTGPIAVEGVRTGDIIAVHLVSLEPARSWGVSTISPNFGALSGTRNNPNLQPEQTEKVWIWQVDSAAGIVSTTTGTGHTIQASLRPFYGSLGVKPPHGEIRSSLVSDAFGGNLDIPDLTAGSTLYLRANVDEAMVYIGDGHYSQGDGELSGTAIEGALNTELIFDSFAGDDILWPRLQTDSEIGVIGSARPLEDAVRIASHALVCWITRICGLELHDAHQLVSQNCRMRIGNLVNPLYTVASFIETARLPGEPNIFEGTHHNLRTAAQFSKTDRPTI